MLVPAPDRIAELLHPYISGAEGVPALNLLPDAIPRFTSYLDLLLRWNARVSLTSIRDSEEIIRRHFGESLFVAAALAKRLPEGAALLDFGSGAGFPGLPVQIALPQVRVTVAESQARKVAFLREAIRTLDLATEVWPRRVEEMPAPRLFEVVTMRAVDKMELMRAAARDRVAGGGWLAALVGHEGCGGATEVFRVPGSEQRYLALQHVPRGTQP